MLLIFCVAIINAQKPLIMRFTGVFCCFDCQRWDPLWIYNVSLAKNLEELFLIISYPKTVEFVDNSNSYWEPDVIIGYYYLMYMEGRLSISDLYDKLTNEDDYSNESVVLDDCDFMNALVDSSAVDLNLLDTVLKPQLYRACCQKKMLELFSQNLIHY